MENFEILNNSLFKMEKELENLQSLAKQTEQAGRMIEQAKVNSENIIDNNQNIFNKIILNFNQASENIISESKNFNLNISQINKSVDILVQKLRDVDFPLRLDKLDSSISNVDTEINRLDKKLQNLDQGLAVNNSEIKQSNSRLVGLIDALDKVEFINQFANLSLAISNLKNDVEQINAKINSLDLNTNKNNQIIQQHDSKMNNQSNGIRQSIHTKSINLEHKTSKLSNTLMYIWILVIFVFIFNIMTFFLVLKLFGQ